MEELANQEIAGLELSRRRRERGIASKICGEDQEGDESADRFNWPKCPNNTDVGSPSFRSSDQLKSRVASSGRILPAELVDTVGMVPRPNTRPVINSEESSQSR